MSRKPQRVNDDRLKELWPSRLPDRELAERMGHSRGALHRRAKAIGLKSRRCIWKEAGQQLSESNTQKLATYAASLGCTRTEAVRRIVVGFFEGEANNAV